MKRTSLVQVMLLTWMMMMMIVQLQKMNTISTVLSVISTVKQSRLVVYLHALPCFWPDCSRVIPCHIS